MTRTVEWPAPQGATVLVWGSVFGLTAEADALERRLETGRFDRVLLGASAEAVAAIAAADGVPPAVEATTLGPVGSLYLDQLSRFGTVHMPALELYAAWRYARDHDVPVAAIDLDDAAHTEAYVDNVSLIENIRKEKRQMRNASRLGTVDDLEAFVKQWDEVFFPTKGLRAVEAAREEHMAQAIRSHSEAAGQVIAVVPLERMDGVLDRLAPDA
jgi:hypothetical protein